MKNLTFAILLRIFALITSSLYVFSISYYNSSLSNDGPQRYILISFCIVMLLTSLQQHQYKKSRPDGRIIYKEMILPEFNSKDERESELTGRAAKAAFSTILLLSPFTMIFLGIVLAYEWGNALFITFLTFAVLPIAGLIAYYFTYRHHYLQ